MCTSFLQIAARLSKNITIGPATHYSLSVCRTMCGAHSGPLYSERTQSTVMYIMRPAPHQLHYIYNYISITSEINSVQRVQYITIRSENNSTLHTARRGRPRMPFLRVRRDASCAALSDRVVSLTECTRLAAINRLPAQHA